MKKKRKKPGGGIIVSNVPSRFNEAAVTAFFFAPFVLPAASSSFYSFALNARLPFLLPLSPASIFAHPLIAAFSFNLDLFSLPERFNSHNGELSGYLTIYL